MMELIQNDDYQIHEVEEVKQSTLKIYSIVSEIRIKKRQYDKWKHSNAKGIL